MSARQSTFSTNATSKVFLALATLMIVLVPVGEALAQCAMCAATVESNSKAQGKSIATGLNTGILYLMVIPYLLFAGVGFVWYRNAKRKKVVKAYR